jgi:prepilin-type N-terminal cleavage/methylation domain-containing protein
MKIHAHSSDRGFTLVEMSMGLGVFALLMACYLSMNIACVRLCSFEAVRFRSAQLATTMTTKMLMEMRGAFSNRVGSITGGDPTTFTVIPNGTNQWGNALQILPTNYPTPWVCYFYVSASNTLYRAQSGNTPVIMAAPVTNYTPVFQELTVAGAVRTNAVATSITSVNLRFLTTNAATIHYFHNPTNYLSFQIQAYPRNF